jgi:hypothetical protein
MIKTELMFAIETGLKNLYDLSPQLVEYYNDIVYDRLDCLIPEKCTAQLLKQIEDDVMQLTVN